MRKDPAVAILTRTKNRPVLLKRAIESVLYQTYPNWEMVIVNDGGEPAAVEQLVDHYAGDARGRIRVVHNQHSLGMEGASAAGFTHLRGELVVVHDDDDSWAPEFLTVAVAQLGHVQQDFPTVRGVTTFCNRVMEHVQGQLIHIDSVEPYNGWIPPGLLSLDRMLLGNVLPPISFVFEREAFDSLGGLYEAIPYLGDWDFLVRFLTQYDVYMVPQYLAFYHWRTRSDSAWLGNTVTGEVDRHQFYRQLLLNRWLRADLAGGHFGIGAYANLRAHFEALLQQGQSLERILPVQERAMPVEPPPDPPKQFGLIASARRLFEWVRS